MLPVSIETPGKHQDHLSCTQETYSYWNGWCSSTLSNFDNLPLSQPARSPKGVIDAIKFWSLLIVYRQPSSFWALQEPNPNLQMDPCRVIQEKPSFPESLGWVSYRNCSSFPSWQAAESGAASQKPSYPSYPRMLEQPRTCSSLSRCCAAAIGCCR